jgi:ubiquitin-conjugating enzyme E2 variant
MEPGIAPPRHGAVEPLTRAVFVVCLLGAAGLVAANLVRFATTPALLAWWVPATVLAGVVVADLASGLVHWTCDTWGSETTPWLGPRFLRPFRVHHVNPEDLLERGFLDLNGDVALLNLPVLVAALVLPLDHAWGQVLAVFAVAYSMASLPTNQVHQWAHTPRPPRLVAWLQRSGLILSPERHRQHHTPPYTTNYCITTGWCNRAMCRVFPLLERLVTWCSGLQPRPPAPAFDPAVPVREETT